MGIWNQLFYPLILSGSRSTVDETAHVLSQFISGNRKLTRTETEREREQKLNLHQNSYYPFPTLVIFFLSLFIKKIKIFLHIFRKERWKKRVFPSEVGIDSSSGHVRNKAGLLFWRAPPDTRTDRLRRPTCSSCPSSRPSSQSPAGPRRPPPPTRASASSQVHTGSSFPTDIQCTLYSVNVHLFPVRVQPVLGYSKFHNSIPIFIVHCTVYMYTDSR